MTETERLAREAGCFTPGANRNYWAVTDPALARFAELVRESERERCAKLCDDAAKLFAMYGDEANPAAAHCAAAIRGN